MKYILEISDQEKVDLILSNNGNVMHIIKETYNSCFQNVTPKPKSFACPCLGDEKQGAILVVALKEIEKKK